MKKIIIAIVVIIVTAGGLYMAYSFGQRSAEKKLLKETAGQADRQTTPAPSRETPENQAQGIPVKVAKVEQRDLTVTQTFYGTAVPYAEANVQGKYSGKIVFLKGEEGDNVKKGEIIVRFDDSDTQLELQRAIAAKNSALEQVNQAQSNFDTIQADVKRQEKLFEDGIIPQKTVDDVRNRLQTTQAALNAAHESVKQTETQISLLENTLSDFKITAPIRGVIDEKRYNLNEICRAGDILYHLIDIDRMYLDIEVPETYISQVKEKMAVEIFFDSLEDQKFSGSIERIVPKGDPQSRSFMAKAVVENPERQIKAGMFSRVNVITKSLSGALIVDKNALLEEPDGYSVFKVSGTQVEKVAVKVQHREDFSVAVLSKKLQPGDQIVVEGIDRLQLSMEMAPTLKVDILVSE